MDILLLYERRSTPRQRGEVVVKGSDIWCGWDCVKLPRQPAAATPSLGKKGTPGGEIPHPPCGFPSPGITHEILQFRGARLGRNTLRIPLPRRGGTTEWWGGSKSIRVKIAKARTQWNNPRFYPLQENQGFFMMYMNKK